MALRFQILRFNVYDLRLKVEDLKKIVYIKIFKLQELITNTNDFKNILAHDNGSDHVLIVTYHVVISNMAWALSLPFQLLAIESNTKWHRHMPLEHLSSPCWGIQHN
uniref:Uncharacterized protein n=1 Tax=Glossina austeni TaxID=7395 RepID=A0A1A9V2K3_GLOAU